MKNLLKETFLMRINEKKEGCNTIPYKVIDNNVKITKHIICEHSNCLNEKYFWVIFRIYGSIQLSF